MTVGRFRLVARHVQQILPRPAAAHADGSNSTIPSGLQDSPRLVQFNRNVNWLYHPSPRIASAGSSLQIKRCDLDSRDCPSRMLQRADPFHGSPLEITSPESHPRRGDEGDQARYGHAQAHRADPAPAPPGPSPTPHRRSPTPRRRSRRPCTPCSCGCGRRNGWHISGTGRKRGRTGPQGQ